MAKFRHAKISRALISSFTLAVVAAASSGCSSSSQNGTDAGTDATRDVVTVDTGVDAGTDATRDVVATDTGVDTGTDARPPRDVPPAMDAAPDVIDAMIAMDAAGTDAAGTDAAGTDAAGTDAAGMDTAPDDAALCSAAQTVQGTPTPLDIFVMLDQSGSMTDTVASGQTKWRAITNAIQAFVQQPGQDGVSVGIQYFGLNDSTICPPCSTDAQCDFGDFCSNGICFNCQFIAADSCTASDYAVPDVEIAPLPGVASPIVTSMGAHNPGTSTPTAPALQGAIDHARSWASAHPSHSVVVVFATDGEPSECSPTDQTGVAAIAAAGYGGTPRVLTFALGVFTAADMPSGPDLLNAIAAAGGSSQAFNITTAEDVQTQFFTALNQVRYRNCQYVIPVPEAGTVDTAQINVQIPASDAGLVTIPKVASAADCPASGDGWHYDDEASPTRIVLCDTTCNALVAQGGVPSVNVVLDCPTQGHTP